MNILSHFVLSERTWFCHVTHAHYWKLSYFLHRLRVRGNEFTIWIFRLHPTSVLSKMSFQIQPKVAANVTEDNMLFTCKVKSCGLTSGVHKIDCIHICIHCCNFYFLFFFFGLFKQLFEWINDCFNQNIKMEKRTEQCKFSQISTHICLNSVNCLTASKYSSCKFVDSESENDEEMMKSGRVRNFRSQLFVESIVEWLVTIIM